MATTKKTGTYKGKSNTLGSGGRAQQLKDQDVPGAVIGAIARSKGAAPGGPNYHKVGSGQAVGRGAGMPPLPPGLMGGGAPPPRPPMMGGMSGAPPMGGMGPPPMLPPSPVSVPPSMPLGGSGGPVGPSPLLGPTPQRQSSPGGAKKAASPTSKSAGKKPAAKAKKGA